MKLVGASSCRGLLDEGDHPAVVVGRYDAVARRVIDLVQRDRGLGTNAVVEGDQTGDVEIGEHVAVHHDEALVDAGVDGREADGAGRVEGLIFYGVVQLDARAPTVGVGGREHVGAVPEREHGMVNAVACRGGR